jgi:hypothetical protein
MLADQSGPSETASADAVVPTDPPGSVRELRLALVCYGGVSLAIYMHGITKEIQKLVLASAALERGEALPAGSTEEAYRRLLERMRDGEVGAASKGVATRVVVDIISGTSAGGITRMKERCIFPSWKKRSTCAHARSSAGAYESIAM